MTSDVATRVRDWSESVGSEDLLSLHAHIDYISRKLFAQYLPTQDAHPEFSSRLRTWLDGASNERDQQLMLRLVYHIYFVGRDEFTALYRTAYRGPLIRWLVDMLNLDLGSGVLTDEVEATVRKTWMCPISDSMKIADFYHVNGLTAGGELRPDWRTLTEFASPASIRDYMAKNGLTSVVLLEDFIGSGSQMLKAVEFACKLGPQVPILLCPLLICSSGNKVAQELARQYAHLRYEAILVIPDHACLGPTANANEPQIFADLRDLVQRLHALVAGSPEDPKAYGPFGYPPSEPIGGLLVMYTNTPDNTVPIVHFADRGWSPLFPRASRL